MPNDPEVRIIVTGLDVDGASVILKDGAPDRVRTTVYGSTVYDLWRTWSTPAEIRRGEDVEDGWDEPGELAPPKSGSIFRIVEFPPDATWVDRVTREDIASDAALGSSGQAAFGGEGALPTTHRTESIDYALVLTGEIVAVVGDDERVMRPGDVLVQRATVHTWSNRSDEPSRVAFVLLGAEIV